MILLAGYGFWWLVNPKCFSGVRYLVGAFFSIVLTLVVGNELIIEKQIGEQIKKLSPVTMVVDDIYQRGDTHIIDFKDYGPYIVKENMLNNLNAGDTVVVKATTKEVYSLKRKK